jgi:serine/threonine protein kinase
MMFTALEHYDFIKEIGRGGYGRVFMATHKTNHETVAVKVANAQQAKLSFSSYNEWTALLNLNHTNIVRLIGTHLSTSQNSFYMLMEFCHMDMQSYFKHHHARMGEPQVKGFMYQLLSGVAYCHANYIIHGDLKPANLLIALNGELKIADFGNAITFDRAWMLSYTPTATLWYRSPDALIGNPEHTWHVDMWSVGCIFAEMAKSGLPLIRGTNEQEQLLLIFELLGTPTEYTWPGFSWLRERLPFTVPDYLILPDWPQVATPLLSAKSQCLLKAMLQCYPLARISAAQALAQITS